MVNIRWAKRIENSRIVSAIRNGLVMIIPILMVGACALTLRSLPVPAYQRFIMGQFNGVIYGFFSFFYNASFGFLSVYMTICIGYTLGNHASKQLNKSELGASVASLSAFLISVGFGTESFDVTSFSAVGMFTAIICGVSSSLIYVFISERFTGGRLFSDGSGASFNKSISQILPITVVCVLFSVIGIAIQTFTSSSNLWRLLSRLFTGMFTNISESFFGAFMYVLLSSLLWFFGVHGSDVLESVNLGLFKPAVLKNAADAAMGIEPSLIYTKTFFDVFVFIGGCGTLLSLLISLFLFSRRRNNRVVAKIAAVPMLFNINEIMVFGLPIIYNPLMFIPFLLTPVSSLIIATVAMKIGLVPLTIAEIEWTTPIFLGGYQATGSVSGAVLQLVILVVGVLIYMPFVRMYDSEMQTEAENNIGNLVTIMKKSEAQRVNVMLTELGGINGQVAKQLANDLIYAIRKKQLVMFYQPQYKQGGILIGAEALLRWKHPSFGYIYPPLIIKLAAEAGVLDSLEKYILVKVHDDTKNLDSDISISINATPAFLCSNDFVPELTRFFPNALSGKAHICVEITEQSDLVNNKKVSAVFEKLKNLGYRLAIDDFSMGCTSLKYLSDNKFDIVKLDGSLVRGLDNPRNRDIIASIVYLSESLGFSVLAEFVETSEQQRALCEIGCRRYQGYLFGKPVPFNDFALLLHDKEHT